MADLRTRVLFNLVWDIMPFSLGMWMVGMMLLVVNHHG